MQRAIRRSAVAGLLVLGSLMAVPTARAQGFVDGGYPAGGSYSSGYSGYYAAPSYGIYGGGGYGVPAYGYYGNGGHDLQPHWHARQGLFGPRYYYGTGQHDRRPHDHVQTPYGITGYNQGRFGNTQSYSPPTPPYVYQPW